MQVSIHPGGMFFRPSMGVARLPQRPTRTAPRPSPRPPQPQRPAPSAPPNEIVVTSPPDGTLGLDSWYAASQLSLLFGIHPTRIHEATLSGVLPAVDVGAPGQRPSSASYVYKGASIAKWLNEGAPIAAK